ncbi:MAG: hypothetical protein LBQ43_04970 [Holosporales bacterium]|nr:hypothetical protein [Holosporales bacterium]
MIFSSVARGACCAALLLFCSVSETMVGSGWFCDDSREKLEIPKEYKAYFNGCSIRQERSPEHITLRNCYKDSEWIAFAMYSPRRANLIAYYDYATEISFDATNLRIDEDVDSNAELVNCTGTLEYVIITCAITEKMRAGRGCDPSVFDPQYLGSPVYTKENACYPFDKDLEDTLSPICERRNVDIGNMAKLAHDNVASLPPCNLFLCPGFDMCVPPDYNPNEFWCTGQWMKLRNGETYAFCVKEQFMWAREALRSFYRQRDTKDETVESSECKEAGLA